MRNFNKIFENKHVKFDFCISRVDATLEWCLFKAQSGQSNLIKRPHRPRAWMRSIVCSWKTYETRIPIASFRK